MRIIIHQYYGDGAGAAAHGEPSAHSTSTVASVCPYRGLETFRRRDARFFAGRDAEIDCLEHALDEHRMIGVIAASGAGKSSLIYAGLIPRLEEHAGEDVLWEIFAFKPGREPIKSLARSLASAFGPYGDLDEEVEQINRRVKNMRFGDVPLSDLLQRLQEKRRAQHPERKHRILLFVDQWEELYTQIDTPEDRDILIRELESAVERIGVQILMTMRADFMGDILSHDPDFFERLKPGIQYLTPMSESAMREAIEAPATLVRLTLQDGLAAQLVKDAEGESGYLAYLQFTLRQLWERRDQQTNTLTLAAYETMGGLRGAIGKHADTVFRKLEKDEQALARRVLPRLASVSEVGAITSRRLPFADFDKPARQLLRKLAEPERRLIVLSSATEDVTEAETVAEVAHEALLDAWNTLSGWIEDRKDFFRLRNKLEADARTWTGNGRRNDFLIPTGKPLLDAMDLVHNAIRGDIGDDLKNFIDISCRRARVKKWWIGGSTVAVMLGIASIVIYLANINQELSSAALAEMRQRATVLSNNGEYEQSARVYLEAVKYARRTGAGEEITRTMSREMVAMERNLEGISVERILAEDKRFISAGGSTFLVSEGGDVKKLVDWEAVTVSANRDLSRFVLFSSQGRASYWAAGSMISEIETHANGGFWANIYESAGFLVLGGYYYGPTNSSSGPREHVEGIDVATARKLEAWRKAVRAECAENSGILDLSGELIREAYDHLSAIYEFEELSDLCKIDGYDADIAPGNAESSLHVYDVHNLRIPLVRETPRHSPWGVPIAFDNLPQSLFEPTSTESADRKVLADLLRWYWGDQDREGGKDRAFLNEANDAELVASVEENSMLGYYSKIWRQMNTIIIRGIDNVGNAGKTNFACMGGNISTRCALFGGTTAENFYGNDMVSIFSEDGDRLLALTGSPTGKGFAVFTSVPGATNMEEIVVAPPTDRSPRNQILDGDVLPDGTRFVVASAERAFVYVFGDGTAEPELEARILAPSASRILGVRLLDASHLVALFQRKPSPAGSAGASGSADDGGEDVAHSGEHMPMSLRMIDIPTQALVWETVFPLEDGAPFVEGPYSFEYPWTPALAISEDSRYVAVRGRLMVHLTGAEYGLYYGAVLSGDRFDDGLPIYNFRFSDDCAKGSGTALLIGDTCTPLFEEQDESASLAEVERRLSRLLSFPPAP